MKEIKPFNVIVTIVFLSVVGIITYTLIKDSHKNYYATRKAEITTIEETLDLPGYVYPSKEVEIKPQLSGVVDEIFVKIGDRVSAGYPIASVSLVPNSSEIEQLQSNVKIASINLDAVSTSYERARLLFEKKAIPRTEYEASEREYKTAQENYNTAVRQLEIRRNDSRKGKNSANIVKASTSGIVIDIPVEVGSSVVERSSYNAGSTVAVLAGDEYYVFKADVPEHNIRSLYVGMPVDITLSPYDSLTIHANIVKISAKGNNINGAVKFPFEAEFTHPGNDVEIRSGYSAVASVLVSKAENVLSLPERCLKFKGDSILVYVTDSTHRDAEERLVRIGLSDGENVEIVEGLASSELVVTNCND